jgi:hypothetical protein
MDGVAYTCMLVVYHALATYSLRPILLFANTDVSTTKMCLDTSILTKSIMGRREYVFAELSITSAVQTVSVSCIWRIRRPCHVFGRATKLAISRPVCTCLVLGENDFLKRA